MQRVTLAGQHIAYAESPDRRSDGAVPLVLLHGGALDHRMWSPQLHDLDGRRVIAPDARGHGGSSDADAPYRLADDVVLLLDALGVERAVLAGVSMGGGTAVDVALEHPDRVAALVVSGAGTSEPDFVDPWTVDVIARWKSAEQGGDVDGWIAAFMSFVAGPRRSPDDVAPHVWAAVEAMARETLATHLRRDADGLPMAPTPPTAVADTWERVRGIRAPVLALCGEDDARDHLRMGRRLADTAPLGEFATTPGAHYPNLDDPDAFGVAMRDFLRRHAL